MADSYMSQIRERIQFADEGSIFMSSDFADIADNNTIRQSLFQLVNSGTVRRIQHGIYEKPKYSKFLGEYIATDPDKVAKALARSYHWTIAPSGNTALNFLGLSTQVPAIWCYVSDGPYKTYQINNTTLEFRHRANRDITGLSYMTALVIQALKTLGRENITADTINRLSSLLSDADKKVMLKEATKCTDWVYEVIRQICGGIKQ